MPTKFRRTINIAVLVLAVPALTGCDKLKTTVSKLSAAKQTQTAAPGIANSDQISEINQASYPDFISRANALMIVDFTATWCGPCKSLAPVLEKATGAHPGIVYVGKVDVDKNPQLAQAQGVRGIPDVRIFKDGKEVDRFVGFPGEQAVLEKVAALSKAIQPTAPKEAPAVPAAPPKPEISPANKDWLPQGMQRR